MSEIAPVLGLLAGVIGVADTLPDVRDTLAGRTRPHRGTWLIWGVLAIVVCLLAAGAVGTIDVSLLLYPVYYCLANGALALLIHHRRVVVARIRPPRAPGSSGLAPASARG